MRLALLAILLAGTAAADTLPPGAWHVVRVDAGPPRCEPWTVAADGALTIAGVTIDTSLDGARVSLGFARRGDESHRCDDAWSVHDLADTGDLDVDGARWFHTAAGCTAALRQHTPVAMDAPSCAAPPPAVAASPQTRARFEHLLAVGGALYAAGTCRRLRVQPTGHDPRGATGHFVTVDDDADARTTTRRPYTLDKASDHLVLLPPEIRRVPKHHEAIETGQYSCICADEAAVEIGDDVVDLGLLLGGRHYLSATRCRHAAAIEHERATWRPR